jgi:hypothetical protein
MGSSNRHTSTELLATLVGRAIGMLGQAVRTVAAGIQCECASWQRLVLVLRSCMLLAACARQICYWPTVSHARPAVVATAAQACLACRRTR